MPTLPIPRLNPLRRNGTSRRTRGNPALDPAFVSVDERSTADLLLYIRRYAQLLNYFNHQNRVTGDWLPFVAGDASVLAAMLLKAQGPQPLKVTFGQILSQPGPQTLSQLLALLHHMATQVMEWQAKAVPGLALNTDLQKLIPAAGQDAFAVIAAYLERVHLLGGNLPFPEPETNLQRIRREWPLLPLSPGFFPLEAGLPAGALATRDQQALSGAFRKLYELMLKVHHHAAAYLEQTLESYPAHEPHMALFLAFTQLFSILQTDQNTLTKRHLDFYYREVLQLTPAPAVADQVHLVIELARGFAQALMTAGERFEAGKDALGNDVFFDAAGELVVNGGKIDEEHGLKTLFFDKKFPKNPENQQDITHTYEISNLYASPDADLPEHNAGAVEGQWHTLGSASGPIGRIGFAIASPMLFLAEGTRTITLGLRMAHLKPLVELYGISTIKSELKNNLRISLTTEKEWTEVVEKDVQVALVDLDELATAAEKGEEIGEITFILRLGLDFPAVTAYAEDVHLEGFGLRRAVPVVRFEVDNEGLSTLGNLDLNLGARLRAFDSNTPYLRGELTLLDERNANGDPVLQAFYRSNFPALGVWPEDLIATPVWENAEAGIAGAAAFTGDTTQGIYYRSAAKTFRANAKRNSAPAPDPDEPVPVWDKLEQSQGSFDPEKNYDQDDIVADNGQIFLALTAVPAISPNKLVSVWRPLPALIPSTGSRSFVQGEFAVQSQEVYRLKARNTQVAAGADPAQVLQEQVWKLIPGVLNHAANTQYTEGNLVRNGNQLFLFRNAGLTATRKLTAAPGTEVASIWSPLPEFDALTSFFNGQSVSENQQAYLPNPQASGLLRVITIGGTLTNREMIRPSANPRLWYQIAEYQPGRYEMGKMVKVSQTNNQPQFFIALKETSAATTVSSDWIRANTVLDISAIPLISSNFGPFVFQLIGGNAGIFYAATVSGIPSHPINLNFELWLNQPTSAWNLTEDYVAGSLVTANNKVFSAAFANTAIEPESTGNAVWEAPRNIAPYASSTQFSRGQLADQGGVVYEANEANVGLSPADAPVIWEKINQIPEYNPNQPYSAQSVAHFTPAGGSKTFYSTLSPVTRFGPSHPSSGIFWNRGGQVSFYHANQNYGEGDLAQVEGVFYIARGEFRGIHPQLGINLWEQVPDAVVSKALSAAYDAREPYVPGEYVVFENAIYRSNAEVTGTAPGSGVNMWEKGGEFSAYDINTTYEPGAYVLFQEQFFRPLARLSGSNYSPDSAPDLWIQAGTILPHNPAVAWYKNMMVKDLAGKVFLALKDVPAGTALSDTTHWEEVPYSFAYKYFVRTETGATSPPENLPSPSPVAADSCGCEAEEPAEPAPAPLTQPVWQRLDLTVAVQQLRTLILENDQGVINPSKPFMPFGATPAKGSRFYIGSHEVFSKSPSRVTLKFQWANLPDENFSTYYSQYLVNGQPPVDNSYFKASFELLKDGVLQPESDAISLFGSVGNAPQTGLPVTPAGEPFSFAPDTFQFTRNPEMPAFSGYSTLLSRGFVTLRLHQGFFHEKFAKLMADAAIAGTAALIPKAPFTPMMTGLSLDYSASERIVFRNKSKGDFTKPVEQFFHIHPFGFTEFIPVAEDDGTGPLAVQQLLPRFLTTVGDRFRNPLRDSAGNLAVRDLSGALFIGLSGLKPPQTLSLLFQVASGSENPERPSQRVVWQYLSQNRWYEFEARDVLSDSTNGLLQPGIVTLNLPQVLNTGNTLLPGNLFWISASVADYPDAVGKVYGVYPQAMVAAYAAGENDPNRMAEPLAAETIASLLERRAEVGKVLQPFASFGGKTVEPDADFYQRVSERLRHKDRAVGVLDYERLILQQFPEVYQVKCLNHSQAAGQNEFSPGHVRVVPLPDLRNQNAVDRLRPRVSQAVLEAIRAFLVPRVSGFTQLEVTHPVFEEVKVSLKVAFLPGKDPGFYLAQLNEDLIRFLSPWLYEDGADVNFGGSLHVSPLVNYLDELGYVDFVTEVVLTHSFTDAAGLVQTLKGEEVFARTSASVLVSASQHSIIHLTESVCLTKAK